MQESDFHEVADQFIGLANELSETWGTPFLTAAFMYAAAHYNSFFCYSASQGKAENQASAIDYYSDQFKQMLQDCMLDRSKTH
jgi:TPR repeat protein